MDWPWWSEFHSFWRELPNYNHFTVKSSTPGVDHAGEVIALFDAPGGEEGDMFRDNGGAELGADEGEKYSRLCLNPYLSVDTKKYGLLQSMGFGRAPPRAIF